MSRINRKRLKNSMRREKRSRRRSRTARNPRLNPGSSGGAGMSTWKKIVIGVGITILVLRGPAIYRGIKGLFVAPGPVFRPTVQPSASASGPSTIPPPR